MLYKDERLCYFLVTGESSDLSPQSTYRVIIWTTNPEITPAMTPEIVCTANAFQSMEFFFFGLCRFRLLISFTSLHYVL